MQLWTVKCNLLMKKYDKQQRQALLILIFYLFQKVKDQDELTSFVLDFQRNNLILLVFLGIIELSLLLLFYFTQKEAEFCNFFWKSKCNPNVCINSNIMMMLIFYILLIYFFNNVFDKLTSLGLIFTKPNLSMVSFP